MIVRSITLCPILPSERSWGRTARSYHDRTRPVIERDRIRYCPPPGADGPAFIVGHNDLHGRGCEHNSEIKSTGY